MVQLGSKSIQDNYTVEYNTKVIEIAGVTYLKT